MEEQVSNCLPLQGPVGSEHKGKQGTQLVGRGGHTVLSRWLQPPGPEQHFFPLERSPELARLGMPAFEFLVVEIPLCLKGFGAVTYLSMISPLLVSSQFSWQKCPFKHRNCMLHWKEELRPGAKKVGSGGRYDDSPFPGCAHGGCKSRTSSSCCLPQSSRLGSWFRARVGSGVGVRRKRFGEQLLGLLIPYLLKEK